MSAQGMGTDTLLLLPFELTVVQSFPAVHCAYLSTGAARRVLLWAPAPFDNIRMKSISLATKRVHTHTSTTASVIGTECAFAQKDNDIHNGIA